MRGFLIGLLLLGTSVLSSVKADSSGPYQPTWESLDSRPTPAWFDEAKLGIFIHWGVYSVPAYGPTDEEHLAREYAEWYPHWMNDSEHPTYRFHRERYGADFTYPEFAPMFDAELWDPDAWAELFKRAGAKYVVLTSKHADGFCLWPSEESYNWNSVDVGPHRDIVKDLSAALRKQDLKVGLYYCLFEWDHPWYPDDMEQFVDRRVLPQLYDIVKRYEPDLIWGDGEWQVHSDVWRSREFLTWLFNESPVKEHVVINDRWGKDTRSKHGGYYTTEYGQFHTIEDMTAVKWEECRGLGTSFGYNRMERLEDYLSPREVIHLLVSTVAKGGNLLLNIGPRADGGIPVIMEERLLQLGSWLHVNGEAIYGTRPWAGAAQSHEHSPKTEPEVFFTSKDDAVYAVVFGWPGRQWVLNGLVPSTKPDVSLLGYEGQLPVRVNGEQIVVDLSGINPTVLPCEYAFVFRLSGMGSSR
jgi:alpha-L-fucosidase